jgi:hypothetical protein
MTRIIRKKIETIKELKFRPHVILPIRFQRALKTQERNVSNK